MKDPNEVIIEVEKRLARLSMQAEQEKAMAEVLPYRFQENMTAFRKYLPEVAEMFESYTPSRSFRFFCNENGIPNLEWCDENIAIYGDNPYEICKSQIAKILDNGVFTQFDFGIENNPTGFIHVEYLNKMVECNAHAFQHLTPIKKIPETVPFITMIGVGLGYQLGYLYEQCRVGDLFLFEPDLDLFYASIFCFDWSRLLNYLNNENYGLHLFLGQNEKKIMNDLVFALHKRGAFLANNGLLCLHYPSPEILKLVDKIKKEFYLLVMGWGFYDDNILALSHCAANLEMKVPFLLKNKVIDLHWQNTPVFVLANGPSLDTYLEVVRQHKDRVIVISCGSTISALHQAGIKPDIHVETERTKSVPDFLNLIDDTSYLKDILFLSTDVIHPDCMKYFNRSGLCFKFDEPGSLLCSIFYSDVQKRAHLTGTNPLAANIGLKMACALGFNKIYLFGVDNGYKDRKHHHSKFSSYFDEQGSVIEKLTDAVIGSSEYSYFVPGNFGGNIITNAMFDTARRALEITIADYPEAHVYNCSDGSLIDGATPLKPTDLRLDENNHLNKNELINHIYQDLYSPLNIDKESIVEYLDVPFFDYLIDRLIGEWSVPFVSREQVSNLMLKQYSYMSEIANSRQRHISKMLVGTLNYIFSLVSTNLYRFEEEKETLDALQQSISIMQDYFKAAKVMYPKALDSVDMVDNSIMNLFRSSK